MDIRQINSAIISGNLTNDELNSIAQAIKYARGQLARNIKVSLRVGDNVNFTSTRTGRNTTGVVTKVAIKYVTVRSTDGLWKVPANMLEVV